MFSALFPLVQSPIQQKAKSITVATESPRLSINYHTIPMQITYDDPNNNTHEELTITAEEIFRVIKLLKSYVS